MPETYKPSAPPKSDKDCWPWDCRPFHETWAHLEGDDPCNCPCHAKPVDLRSAWDQANAHDRRMADMVGE